MTMQIYARLTKVDEATRRVYGRATQEVPDRADEVFDYEASKPHFVKWSSDIEKVTDGKSVGNVRAMHGKVAAGKLSELTFNDAEKAIDVCAEIIDDNEWKKCQAGVYTGFSVGGKYGKKWTDPSNPALKRYEAIPAEVSLVDLPCVPTANFTMVKADGATVEVPLVGDPEATAVDEIAKLFDAGTVKPTEMLKMLEAQKAAADETAKAAKVEALKTALANENITIGEVEKLAVEHLTLDQATLPTGPARAAFMLDALQKHAGMEKRDFSEAERDKAADSGAAMPDGSFPIKTKEDLANAVKAYGRSKNPQAAKAHIKTRAKALGAEDMLPDAWDKCASAEFEKVAGDVLAKDLWSVGRLAEILSSLWYQQECCKAESEREGDNSPVCSRLEMVCKELGEILCEMAEEETQEMADGTEKAALDELKKVGARHSAMDKQRLNGIHDHSVAMGANCPGTEKISSGALAKALGVEATDEAAVEKAVQTLMAKAKSWDDLPAQPKGVTRVVEKTADGKLDLGNDIEKARDDEFKRAVDSGDPLALMKLTHKYGGIVGASGIRK